MNLAQSATFHWNYYTQVKAVIVTEHADAPYWPEWEDYLADAVAYDVWTEGPAEYERDNDGHRPGVPLTKARREALKARGFTFHKDGTVRYHGTPARQWAEEHAPKPEAAQPALF